MHLLLPMQDLVGSLELEQQVISTIFLTKFESGANVTRVMDVSELNNVCYLIFFFGLSFTV